jgi:predicted dehydrogenase
MDQKLRVGIVGSPRGGGYLSGFRSVAQTEVVAMCDLNPQTLKESADDAGVELRFTNYEEMLDKARLDLVVVSTPMPFHTPQAVAALQRGVHVMSEVPAATDLEQCWQLVEAVRASKARYMMCENYTYMKPNVLVRAMAHAGAFGELYYGEGGYIHELKGLNEITKWRRFWQTGINGNTYPTHSLGPLLQWMRTRVVTVTCMGTGHHYRDARGEDYANEDSTTTLCRLATGGMVTLRLDMLSNRPHNMVHYALQGTYGCYESGRGGDDEPRVWLKGRSKDERTWQSLWEYEPEFLPGIWRNPSEEAKRAGHGGGDYFQVREFVDSIVNDTKPPIDVYEALDFTVPGLISQESIRRGSVPLPVPDFRTVKKFPAELPAELQNACVIRVRAENVR